MNDSAMNDSARSGLFMRRAITAVAVVIAVAAVAVMILWVQSAGARPPLSLHDGAERVLLDSKEAQALLPTRPEQEDLADVTGGEVTTTSAFPMVVRADTIDEKCREIYWPSVQPVATVGTDTSSFHDTGGYSRVLSKAEVMTDAEAAQELFQRRQAALEECDAFSYRITANSVVYARTNAVAADSATNMVPTFRLDSTLNYTIDDTDYEQVTTTTYYLVGNVVVTWSNSVFAGMDALEGLDQATDALEERILDAVEAASDEVDRAG